MNPAQADPGAAVLPPPLAWLAARLPHWPPALALAVLINATLDRLVAVATLAPLQGKIIELHLTDAGVRLRLRFDGRRFWPVLEAPAPDVLIGASTCDFYLLARRRADPDSLFFRRRLIMQGDTELALLVKNTLDGIDFAALVPARPRRINDY